MSPDSSAGDRVREARKRAGLTQDDLATASGMSISLIKKLESGDYCNELRRETVHKLAVALKVTTSSLSSEPQPPVPEPEDSAAWDTVMRALRGDHDTQPDDEPAIGGIRDALADLSGVFLDSRYVEVRGTLPLLLRDADALVSVSSGRSEKRARTVRSEIRQLAGTALASMGHLTQAAEAIGLAGADAVDDLTALAVADGQCFVLLRQGKLDECAQVAMDHAARCEPAITARPDELAAWGQLMLRASTAAARDNRRDDAREALRLAKMAASGVGRDIVSSYAWLVFGPVTVAMMGAEIAAVQDRPDVTLAIGSQVTGHGYPVRRNVLRHRLDVARAHVAMRRHDDAVAVLAGVREAAPEWAARQRYAADILSDVIAHRRKLSEQVRDLADFLSLPL